MFAGLHPTVKNYAWGIPNALSRFLGKPDTGLPEAELWMGDHPLAQCDIDTGNGLRDLVSWLASENRAFPLLVKVLAASTPLSIQVHPSADQAQLGYESEEARGIPRDAPERSYKDRSAKPELLIALSDTFTALAGFVPLSTVAERLDRWGRSGLSPEAVSTLRGAMADSLEHAVEWILAGGDDVAFCAGALGSWATEYCSNGGESVAHDDARLVSSLWGGHHGDSGVLFALVMHRVVLSRGQALFVIAGEVHAYIDGFGLEVMLPSDNVVRAGLTHKHRDIQEFVALADFTPRQEPARVDPSPGAGGDVYAGFGAPFRVTRVSAGARCDLGESDAVVVVESGSLVMTGSLTTERVTGGALVYVTDEETVLHCEGDGTAWIVQVEEVSV